MAALVGVVGITGSAGALELTDPAALGGRGQHGTAALAPVAGGDGWGRVELSAAGRSGTTVADGLVLLYGLEPNTVYTVMVGGATVATVTTDGFGDASLRVGSHVGTAVQLPAGSGRAAVDVVDASWGLVLAGELELKRSANDDDGGSPVLSGSFTGISQHGDDDDNSGPGDGDDGPHHP